MIGVYKVASDSNFAAASLWIMVCLMLSSWVRTIMKDKGVWDLNEDDLGDDYNAFYVSRGLCKGVLLYAHACVYCIPFLRDGLVSWSQDYLLNSIAVFETVRSYKLLKKANWGSGTLNLNRKLFFV